MFLKTLEAQGFKSFPDKTVLSFEKGITAVVGPNGSGKSNIADAISWVLGEQSTKQLRGEKMEDVIFNGASTRSAHGMAYVTICFDNSDHSLQCDAEEVYITRRYYRSGESKYEINHNTVRLKDINELFMDTGIGRDGYSMIGQGKISEIVGKRSEDRRDMIEEAAGISRYRYRKQEATRKLESAEENLIRLRDILGELTERVGPLERESKKAQSFLEYSTEKKSLEIGIWLLKLNKIKEQVKTHEEKLITARNQYAMIEQQIIDVNDIIEAKSGLVQEITVMIDEMRRSSGAFEEQAAVTEGQVAVSENNIMHLEENVKRIENQINDAAQGGTNLDSQIDALKNELEEKKKIISSLMEDLNKATEEFEKFIQENEQISKRGEELNVELSALQAAISECDLKIVSSETSVEQINNRRTTIDAVIKDKLEYLEELKNEHDELNKDLDVLEEKINSRNNTISGIDILINTKDNSAKEIKEKIDKLIIESQTKKQRALMLREMEKNMEEFNNSVKFIIKESQRGTIGGIIGPVSKIVSVPSEYSIAIETALGNAIQNIVVESENDAKRAIELLKKNREGRATFLPLTSVKRRNFNEKDLDDCYGFVGVASELVEYDDKFSDVISSLLGAIVVTEDLDSAVVIAKKYSYRFKIVTLDGQVVNSGGSITGGSLVKNAGVLGRSNDIKKLEEESKKIDQEVNELNDTYADVMQQLNAKKAEVENVRSEIITINEDKIRIVGEIKHNEEAITDNEEQLEELNKEVSDSDSVINNYRKDIELNNKSKEEYISKQNEIREELVKIEEGQTDVDDIRTKMSETNASLRLDILAHEKERDSIVQQIDSIVALKNDAQGQIANLKKEIENINHNKEQEQEHILNLKSSANALREQAKECVKKINEYNDKRTEAEGVSSSKRAEEKELNSKKEMLSQEVARLSERSDNFTKDTDDIVARLYDEYELTLTEAENLGIVIENPTESNKRLSELKNKIKSLGSVNVGAIEEYKEVKSRYDFLSSQVNDVEESKAKLIALIEELTGTMQELFIGKFNVINANFGHTFVDLFGGGTAELILTDPIDVLNSGIDIHVNPPGKKVSSLDQLSGGEKSLVAIAIYFAMMKVSPPPFCMLDEVESALDDVNVDRFASYLRKMSDNTQFVVVTHRRGSMEEADVLYGVTMQEKGVSKLLKLKISEVDSIIRE